LACFIVDTVYFVYKECKQPLESLTTCLLPHRECCIKSQFTPTQWSQRKQRQIYSTRRVMSARTESTQE